MNLMFENANYYKKAFEEFLGKTPGSGKIFETLVSNYEKGWLEKFGGCQKSLSARGFGWSLHNFQYRRKQVAFDYENLLSE